MTTPDTPGNNRSIQIGGSVTGSAVVTGDGNTVSVQFNQANLPAPETVNIQAELQALRDLLTQLDDPIVAGVAKKLEQEAAKPEPDKSVIAKTLETGLAYAQDLVGFGEAIDKLRPHVEATASWLGQHGHKLLPLVGLIL
ncbi:hypothetical protein [Phormidium sp. FACHB-1136]|uniref:hypothetical protein n=1 Tax=Phormidium sp. FACHB-1136 TaxID=2692848 RepID=UPI0018EF6975|nr:hypothetical protein [Phormidium sp. FACHB-1136]